jgi:subtilisin family serine protease
MHSPRSLHPRRVLTATVATAAAAATVVALPVSAETATVRTVSEAIPGSYIVVLKDNSATAASALTTRYGGTVTATWQHALNGFAARMGANEAALLAQDPNVSLVQESGVTHILDSQQNAPPWGLDRIDQRQNARDSRYTFETLASNVHAYVIDTGIRVTHATFDGRASWGTRQ